MTTNTLTGISSGTFNRIALQHSGSYQDLSTLISSLGGGAGVVNSATLPLSILNGVLSVDLTAYSSTAAINTILAGYVLATTLANYSTTTVTSTAIATALANSLSAYTDTTGLTTLLALKEDALTTGAGVFKTGATISSYTLRWNGTSTPTLPTTILELHWDGYTMAETVNAVTGKIELTIGHPDRKSVV